MDADRFEVTFGIAPSDLMERAVEYRARAYAPYSGFLVGAAILIEGGNIIGGCNVENASYGMTLCAERVAMANAVASGFSAPLAIAVAAAPGVFCPPCGACRQFLSEFNPRLAVVLMNGAEYEIYGLDDLLPRNFSLRGVSDD
ncbi:MAG: cytidine deaminase [Synergistaceae bacterium]|jgi:cytidine deaminase|nr:cytidine deaminase [Synergistaceae bacterium]